MTFYPDSPWEVGQRVTFRHDNYEEVKVVESVEHSDDETETEYTFVSERAWELRKQGVRPYIELDD